MKGLKKIWEGIHALPEEIRRLLSNALMAVAAIILFVAWGAAISSRLAVISENSNVALQTFEQKRNAASESIALPSLFSSFKQFFPDFSGKPMAAEKIQHETSGETSAQPSIFEKAGSAIENFVSLPGKFLLDKLP